MAKLAKMSEQNLLPPANLAEEIERLHEKLENEHDLHLRTMADFKNYRRRIELDGNRLAEESKRKIILQFLEIMDDMDKMLQWGDEEGQNLIKGMQNIREKLLAMLKTLDVLPFDSLGTQFDHDLHEAVSIAEHEDIEQGTVIDELRRGYLWKNQLLRPAQVRVAG
jgi:molecular chaperone GrpE